VLRLRVLLLQARRKRIITPCFPTAIEIHTRIPLVAVDAKVVPIPVVAIRYIQHDVDPQAGVEYEFEILLLMLLLVAIAVGRSMGGRAMMAIRV